MANTTDPKGPINDGKDTNFFKKITVNSASFQSSADISFNFKNQVSFSLVNEGSEVVEYSFNGNTLHGDMTPSTTTAAIFFDGRRVSKIWFRTGTPGQVVRVEAWA